jgi:hypothetical protein
VAIVAAIKIPINAFRIDVTPINMVGADRHPRHDLCPTKDEPLLNWPDSRVKEFLNRVGA